MPDEFVPLKARLRLEKFIEAYRKSQYATSAYNNPTAIVPSPIDESMVREHEDLIGARLPPLFRAYLMAASLTYTDFYVGQLPSTHPDRPFEWVERWSIEKMEQPFYRSNRRLIPFTHGPADMSDLCFDIERPDSEGDFPIIKVSGLRNFKAVAWPDRNYERCRVFRSFSAYLEYLHESLVRGTESPGTSMEDWLSASGIEGPADYYLEIG